MIMKKPNIKKVIANSVEKKVAIKSSTKEKLGYTITPLITLSGKLLITLLVWPFKRMKSFKINLTRPNANSTSSKSKDDCLTS